MPAGITSSDSMFSVRETPWHGLGAVLERPPGTIAEAIEASGLGWRVEQAVGVVPLVVLVSAADQVLPPKDLGRADFRQIEGDALDLRKIDHVHDVSVHRLAVRGHANFVDGERHH